YIRWYHARVLNQPVGKMHVMLSWCWMIFTFNSLIKKIKEGTRYDQKNNFCAGCGRCMINRLRMHAADS
ncbi:hypothetical protein, partial [Pantoea eucalypti]|uniref:hypothetical protein n=1 Tax=Pantoea eucalypti TaxID=470933 RepID=UPI00289AB23F